MKFSIQNEISQRNWSFSNQETNEEKLNKSFFSKENETLQSDKWRKD